MKNNYKNMREDLTGDAVIQRGYDIYDMWEEKKFSSKKIVSYVNYELSLLKEKKTNSQKIELLSCLFALDLRIKERYKSFIRCLVSYFSWSRETRALRSVSNCKRR